MPSIKPTVAEKRDNARKAIMRVAEGLFYRNGYDETSIKDIIREAGILNGSLYNRFRNKEEILLSILSDVFSDVLDRFDLEFEKERDPLVILIFPSAVEVYLSSVSFRFARLIYQCHRTWSAVNGFVTFNYKWTNKYLKNCEFPEFSYDDIVIKTTFLLGAVGNICGYYANGGKRGFGDFLKDGVVLLSSTFNLPLDDVDAVVDRILDLVRNCDLSKYSEYIFQIGSEELGHR
ncbi:MAG: TetR/AcrR family transcriptional regulator [archaeon]|nr:TetR/AcrR family transcriptional regulator [archaeon]